MDDPEGHEVRQSHLSCPTKAGAGRSVRGFGMSRDFDGRCPECHTLIEAGEVMVPARSPSELPSHIIIEGEAPCGCHIERHCTWRDEVLAGPLWRSLWNHFRYGWSWDVRVLVRCPKHGGDRSVLYLPTSWTGGKLAWLTASEAAAIIFGTFIAVLVGAALFFVITGRWPT